MDNNKDRKFLIYLGIGATLGAAYWAINYLSNSKTSKAKPLTLEKTRKILQQIKFQILTTCTTFVQGLKGRPKTNHSQQDLEIFYRTQLAKVYEMRQETILSKFIVSKDQYAASLNQYKKDPKIQQGQKEIIEILQNATKSVFPDYTVPRPAKTLLTQQQVLQVYLEMCELISVRVWEKLDEEKQKNPGFNSKDDTHFKKAIRQLSIYDIKSTFLEKKGFRPEWGCPNEVFYKVMESLKQENKEIKNRAAVIEKAYQKIIERITNQPQHLNAERIKFLFDEIVNNKAPEVKAVPPQVQPKPQVPLQRSAPAPPAKKEEEFNMDQLMMQQLMSRSQEQPKQEKKIENVPTREQQPEPKQVLKEQVQINLNQISQRANEAQQVGGVSSQQPQPVVQQISEVVAVDTVVVVPVEKAQVESVVVVPVESGEIIAEVIAEEVQIPVLPEPIKTEEKVLVVEVNQNQNNPTQIVENTEVLAQYARAEQINQATHPEKIESVANQQVEVQNSNAEVHHQAVPPVVPEPQQE